ncbi:hypothetical protein DUNSADRAFT_3128 [Dunaliella salina]|uniref:Uncharacterized protein n=1 Tax=Dunaliella salina TaxID=3046 RepID=A0ABQ7H823_DUNSA|nr:hypothetical protein DUNSADRAFT_3128 [Dunaliella salina]|eukprot:KAF5842999.1 hypothetical protein DUNSADRAFT_3128 [Dunaliella salina]
MASKAAAHTDEAVIKRCQGQDFLALCIVKSGFDNELCTDVTDACEVAELNALDLASGDLSCEEAAQRLFLVNTEAKKLLKVCSRMCAREGVNFGDGIADAESSEEERAETVQTASPTPEAIGDPSDTSKAAEADGPSRRTGTEEGQEAGLPRAEGLTREQQEEQERAQRQFKEEQERKQQQLKEEQLAAARAAFAPKAIPASAVTTAASAVQPMQTGFPPGFSPPPPLGSSNSKSNKPSPAIPPSRKLSAYDGSSFGVRENTHTPSPIQSSRTTGRHAAAAPSPRTPPVNVVDFNNFISASVRQTTTPRMGTSVAASR